MDEPQPGRHLAGGAAVLDHQAPGRDDVNIERSAPALVLAATGHKNSLASPGLAHPAKPAEDEVRSPGSPVTVRSFSTVIFG